MITNVDESKVKMWTSDRRVYINKEGKVVDAKSPDRTTLIVAEGGRIPHARALELGLIEVEAPKAAKKSEPVKEDTTPVGKESEPVKREPKKGK